MDIVKSSKKIHIELHKRWEEQSLKQSDIIKEAALFGVKITKSRLSSYKKSLTPDENKKNKSLSQEHIIFLCYLYGIFIKLQVGKPVIERGKPVVDKDGDIKYEVPPYNRAENLKRLKAIGY